MLFYKQITNTLIINKLQNHLYFYSLKSCIFMQKNNDFGRSKHIILAR